LLFFILTVPVAAGTIEEVPKVNLRAQEENEKRRNAEHAKNKRDKMRFWVKIIFIEIV
jgi:hypothetical protein